MWPWYIYQGHMETEARNALLFEHFKGMRSSTSKHVYTGSDLTSWLRSYAPTSVFRSPFPYSNLQWSVIAKTESSRKSSSPQPTLSNRAAITGDLFHLTNSLYL